MEEQLFRFDANDIKRYIVYDMHIFTKMSKSFNYVFDKLVALKYHKELKPTSKVHLEKLKWDEGKNYNWFALTYDNVKLIIRAYHKHFTIFSKTITTHKFDDGTEFKTSKNAGFTFYTNTEHMSGKEADSYCDNPFIDLNATLIQMLQLLSENKFHSLDCSVDKPKHCEIRNVFHSDETIHNFDKFIFCMEELSSKHLELFSENDMLENIKKLTDKVGCNFDSKSKIKEVVTEFPKQYSDPYYHGVGILTVDSKGKTEFHDVYRLTYWHTEEIDNLLK